MTTLRGLFAPGDGVAVAVATLVGDGDGTTVGTLIGDGVGAAVGILGGFVPRAGADGGGVSARCTAASGVAVSAGPSPRHPTTTAITPAKAASVRNLDLETVPDIWSPHPPRLGRLATVAGWRLLSMPRRPRHLAGTERNHGSQGELQVERADFSHPSGRRAVYRENMRSGSTTDFSLPCSPTMTPSGRCLGRSPEARKSSGSARNSISP